MGTRADFYVGRGKNAEWIGSIAWDGYPDGLPDTLLRSKTERTFRKHVAELASRFDFTDPKQGWPWPWDDSNTTDYSYAFERTRTKAGRLSGQVWGSYFGYGWWPADKPEPEADDDAEKTCEFPDMSEVRNFTLGKRSGVLLVRAR